MLSKHIQGLFMSGLAAENLDAFSIGFNLGNGGGGGYYSTSKSAQPRVPVNSFISFGHTECVMLLGKSLTANLKMWKLSTVRSVYVTSNKDSHTSHDYRVTINLYNIMLKEWIDNLMWYHLHAKTILFPERAGNVTRVMLEHGPSLLRFNGNNL